MPQPTYTAESLEDIASMFDRNATQEANAAARAALKKNATLHNGAASAWRAAASILRDTTLAPEPAPTCPRCGEEWHADGGCRDPECPEMESA